MQNAFVSTTLYGLPCSCGTRVTLSASHVPVDRQRSFRRHTSRLSIDRIFSIRQILERKMGNTVQ